MIKSIIFDLGNVIVPVNQDLVFDTLSIASKPEIDLFRRTVLAAPELKKYHLGEISTSEFLEFISASTGGRFSDHLITSAWNSMLLPNPIIPAQIFDTLSKTYPLYVLSDTNELHFEHLKSIYPLLESFRGYIVSHEVGSMKPSREIFERAVSLTGFAANECLFIDDLDKNVEGAEMIGLKGIVFRNLEQLRREIREYGIDFPSL